MSQSFFMAGMIAILLMVMHPAKIHSTSLSSMGRSDNLLRLAADKPDDSQAPIDILLKAKGRSRDASEAMVRAVAYGQGDTVRKLLAHGADPNTTDQYGKSVLAIAADVGNEKIARLLLAKGAKINLTGPNTDSALMSSIPDPHQEGYATRMRLFRLFLQRGADVNFKDAEGGTALMLGSDNIDVVRLLLAHGARVNERNGDGQTALFEAVMRQDLTVPKYLIDHGATVNVQDTEHGTPLMMAALYGNLEVVKLLLAHGADPTLIDDIHETALDKAQEKHYTQVAAVLKAAMESWKQKHPSGAVR